MFIGDAHRAHMFAISASLRLVHSFNIFEGPTETTILLSPSQYIVRSRGGKLLPAIEKFIDWRGSWILADEWAEMGRRILEGRKRRPMAGWRYAFTGPHGPRLQEPTLPFVLAHQLVYGIKTRAGFRIQGYESGWPTSKPKLLVEPTDYCLVAAGSLDHNWFTGLPFDQAAIDAVSPCQDVTVQWHHDDDLVTPDSVKPDRLVELLKAE